MFETRRMDYFGIMEMAKKGYGKLLAPICEENSLTRKELDVLLFLHNNPDYDRAADIVTRRGMTKSHVSLSVAGLEEKGLLLRRFDESDRRTAHLTLTDRSREIAEQARQKQILFFGSIYKDISREELESLANITEKIWNNIRNLEAE